MKRGIILILTIFLVLGMTPGINAYESGEDSISKSDDETKDDDDSMEDNSHTTNKERTRIETDHKDVKRIEVRKRTDLENRKRLRTLVESKTGKDIAIEVDLKENEAEIRIKINGDEEEFSIPETDRGSIIKAIQERTDLTVDEIVRTIHVERERENEVEIKIENNEARIKIETNDLKEEFILQTTDKETILATIAERLGTTPDKISNLAEIEFRERKRFRTEKGLEEIEIEEETDKGKIKRKIKIRNHIAETRLELKEEFENGELRLRAKLSNGNFRDVKVMPDRASDIAIERLKAQNIEIELRERGDRAFFEARSEKQGRFLGLFKARLSEKIEIDSETGEVTNQGKPFWAFLLFNEQPVTDQI
tara:strand:- start:150 stop:1247 length:1098 start_codon:yes stop_codon:yes gene_type:complete